MDEDNRAPGIDEDESEAGNTGRFGRAREFVGSKYNEMREKVDDVDLGAVTDQVRSYVRSNPGKALLISVGAGFLIGLLLRSDDDEN